MRKLIPASDRACRRSGKYSRAHIQNEKEKNEMRTKGKRTKGIEEARPFAGMSQVNQDAAGVDIGAVEIVACVAGDASTQIVKAFGNYTVDLQAIRRWLK